MRLLCRLREWCFCQAFHRRNRSPGAIYGTGGAQGAVKWQPDSLLFGYRRIFTLPSAVSASDAILSKGDSFYYESNNTTDVYEAIMSKSPSGSPSDVLRVDINKNSLRKYYESSLQIDAITIGPEKALKIAMLDPAFQDFKNNHTDYLLDAQLSEARLHLEVSPSANRVECDLEDPRSFRLRQPV